MMKRELTHPPYVNSAAFQQEDILLHRLEFGRREKLVSTRPPPAVMGPKSHVCIPASAGRRLKVQAGSHQGSPGGQNPLMA